jgi:hypothetical protein
MMSWRADGALYEYYTGSAWMPLTASYEALSRSKVMSFIPAAPIAFTSASATNLSGSGTGSFSMSFTKRYAASEIELQVSCVIYAASTSPVPFQVYPVVSFAGTDYKVPASGFTFEIASSYRTVHGIVRVPGGVAAGAYTLQSKIQLAQTGSGRQANMDQFTHFTCRCEEIAVL